MTEREREYKEKLIDLRHVVSRITHFPKYVQSSPISNRDKMRNMNKKFYWIFFL
jgi:hypothetical protein